MKRILSFLLIAVLMFSLAACQKDDDKVEAKVDIEYFAELGQIPECKYRLGQNGDDIKKELSESVSSDSSEEHGEEGQYFEIQEGKNNVLLDNGIYNFYYKKADSAKKISYIVSYDTAYEFKTGTIIKEVIDSLGDLEYKKEKISENDLFFLIGAPEGDVIKLEFEKNTVIFVFIDNALCATAIYTNDWS